MLITVDDREHMISGYMDAAVSAARLKSAKTISYKIERIDRGDYLIHNDSHKLLAVVERKTLDDYAASIKDGRHKNIRNLIDMRTQTGCHIVYIIEGPHIRADAANFANQRAQGIALKTIQGSIFRLMVRNSIHVIWSCGPRDTAYKIAYFTCAIEDVPVVSGAADDTSVYQVPLSESLKNDPYEAMWETQLGIGSKTAADIAANYNVIEFLAIEAPHKYFKFATRLANERDAQINLLAGVPMISKSMAAQIISQINLHDICLSDTNILSKCNIGAAKKLGPKRAENILSMIRGKR